jgi:Flp pilus assembly protein TadG
MNRNRDSVLAFAADRRGTSAIEFAVMAPVLIVGLLIVTDVGLAVNDRMRLDQATRAGAEFAMNSVDDGDTIEDMVKASATGAYGTDLNDVDSEDIPDVEAEMYCECPDAPGVVAACSALCTGDVVPSAYWRIEASKNYNGVFIPSFPLATQITVQTR